MLKNRRTGNLHDVEVDRDVKAEKAIDSDSNIKLLYM